MSARVVMIGNSAAALNALESFRLHDRQTPVTLISDEPGRAYSRVLLPYYLRRKVSLDVVFIREDTYYGRMGAGLVSGPGARVEQVDPAARRLELADGRRLGYERLLIATGSRPMQPPIPGLDHPAVHRLWTLDDALALDPLFCEGARVLVLGSGFVALQAAWAAARRGSAVTVVELEGRIMPRVLDEPAARLLHSAIEAYGVAIEAGVHTERVEDDGHGALRVHTRELAPLDVDVAIVATGVRPNDGLLPEALEPGLPGIPVNARMATRVDGVFAAGDVTRGPTARGGPPEIHALWPTAVEQGKVAGANLAGIRSAYDGSLSMNVTEMFGLTVASLGRFVESEGERARLYEHISGVDYLKVVTRDDVPVGAVAVGGPEAALLLGRLRPFVRHGRAARRLRSLLEEGAAAPVLRSRADGAVVRRGG